MTTFIIKLTVVAAVVSVLLALILAFSRSKDTYSIDNTRNIVTNSGSYILQDFVKYYDIGDYNSYVWGTEEICRRFNTYCETLGDTGNFLSYVNPAAYTQYKYVLEEAYLKEARDQFLFSVETFCKAESNRMNTILPRISNYMTESQFNSIFSFIYPVESDEINVFLWEFQIFIYLEMLNFLNTISDSGGSFLVNRLDTFFYMDWSAYPSINIQGLGGVRYKAQNYRITIDPFTLYRLVWYNPSGTWTYEFMLLLSLYNLVNTKPWLYESDNINIHPDSVQKDFLNNIQLQNNLTPGYFIPIISPGNWVNFIFGAIRNGTTEAKFKLEWNSSYTQNNNNYIVNAYGNRVEIPSYSFNSFENPCNKSGYKDYLFNCLIYSMLERENPITLPYSNNSLMSSVLKFSDQYLCLRKQDYNRRCNLDRTTFFNIDGCLQNINTFRINNQNNSNGFTGYLTKMRENILDTINDFPPPYRLSGWFFNIIKPYIRNRIPNFPNLVVNNNISGNTLLEIKRLEGCKKPVANPTSTPGFGDCRPVKSCRKCRKTCNRTNCGDLRSHAANDYYGVSGDDVLSTYFGVVIGVNSSFFTDQCERNGTGSNSCPPGYTCNSNEYCADDTGNLYRLPSVQIKHIDGTIGRYGEFPLIVTKGKELLAGEKIGDIVVYTNQCHFELYAGTVNMIPWVEGGFGYNSENAFYIQDQFVSTFSVTANPPAMVRFPTLFQYQYIPNQNNCISNCKFNCNYKRRRDLLNTNNTRQWA